MSPSQETIDDEAPKEQRINEHYANSEHLNQYEWFWGDADRGEVDARLVGQPEGAFCIRHSSTPGDYTLTLRKDGCNKLVKIYAQNGRYCLSVSDEAESFASLAELVQFYCTHSLQTYNRILNIVLRHAVPRYANGAGVESRLFKIGQLVKDYALFYVAYVKKTDTYDRLYEKFQQLSHHLEGRRQALLAFDETIKYFNDCLQLHSKFKNMAQEHESKRLAENHDLLTARLDELKENEAAIAQDVDRCSAQLRDVDCKLNDMKPELYRLFKLQESAERHVAARGLSVSKICRMLSINDCVGKSDESAMEAALSENVSCNNNDNGGDEDDNNSDKNDYEESIRAGIHAASSNLWLLTECGREDCVALLTGRPNGTYLVRPSTSRNGCYALSVVSGDHVFNCLIETRNCCYGFTGTDLLFSSLNDLILYYSINSLKDHNPNLDTTLLHPIGLLTNVEQRRPSRPTSSLQQQQSMTI